ncbi:MAG: helix-turn-helix domain-containing protein [Corynebacterium variabile]
MSFSRYVGIAEPQLKCGRHCSIADVPLVDGSDHHVELRHPHVWWVSRGSLHVTGPGRSALRVDAGWAVSIDRGVTIRVTRDSPETVAFGFPRSRGTLLPFEDSGEVDVGEVPVGWNSLMVEQFAENLSYLRRENGIAGSPGQRGQVGSGPDDSNPLSRPPLPQDSAARRAALALVRDPGYPGTVGELAASVFVSPATLNRTFREETSCSVGEWRTRLRIALAAEELAVRGGTVESVAHRVGLSSASALCRLFRERTGVTPATVPGIRTPEDAALSGTDPLGSTGPTGASVTRTTDSPGRSTWERTNRLHVLVAAWRGDCQVTAGNESVHVPEGFLAWLPAGLPNQVAMEPGALVLPVGARSGSAPGAHGPVVMGPSGQERALSALTREYDPLQPERTGFVDDLFCTYLVQTSGEETGDTVETADAGDNCDTVAPGTDAGRRQSAYLDRMLDEFRRVPATERTRSQWAEYLGCSVNDVALALEMFGVRTLREWHSSVRMGTARRLLTAGVAVGDVAGFLGYRSVSSFSHVFRRHHGKSPQTYNGYA